MGSEESSKSNRLRMLLWANFVFLALCVAFFAIVIAALYRPGDTASYETADRYMQEVKKLSTQGFSAVTEEVDHMFHYLTNTNDDDGHIQMMHHHTAALVSQADAHAALAGEEPVAENHPLAAQSRIENAKEEDLRAPLIDDVKVELEATSDGDSAAREADRQAALAVAEENPQEQDTEGHEGEVEAPEEEEEVTEEQRQELQRAEAEERKALQEAALQRDTVALMEMGAQELIVPMARVQKKQFEEMENEGLLTGDAEGKDAKFIEQQMVKRRASHKKYPKCGAMPKSFGPKFTEQREPPQGKTKVYPSKNGFVMPLNLENKQIKVPTEHGKRGSRKATNKRQLKSAEQALVDCLNNLGKCTSQSMRAALGLRGMKEALIGSKKLLTKKYQNCAVVGNSGGMMHHKYGDYIDTHDYVMRINALPMDSRRDHLGSRVDGRVLSYKISKDVCCIKKDYTADNADLEFFIWFPAAQKDVAVRMKKKLKSNPVRMMQKPFVKSAVLVFKAMRGELLRLGYGPFEDWEYMTSGMHAVLGMIRSCENLDVYGFTTDLNKKGPYWFTGRASPPRSGQTQHAWDHERMVLRLLHAAGAVNLCTT